MMAKRIALTGLIVALALLGFLGTVQAAAVLENVAVLGDESPIADHFYKEFGNPVTSDDATNKAGFFGRVKGDDVKRCLFKVDSTGAGSELACKGDIAPGGGKYIDFRDYSINTGGVMAWASSLTGGKSGVFRGDPTAVSLLGDAVPGGGLLKSFSKTAINDDGDVVYRGEISPSSSTDQAIFRCPQTADTGTGDCNADNAALEKLVQKGDELDDIAGRFFCALLQVDASNFGIVFKASTKEDCDDDTESSKVGMFRMPFGGAIETMALEKAGSEPFPDVGGTKYDEFTGSPSIENGGIVAFSATTKGLLAKENLYLCDPGVGCPTLADPEVFTAGDIIPEAPVQAGDADACGGDFVNFGAPALSDAGDMAFSARSTKGVRGVYIHRFATDALEAVACKGDLVPDVLDGEFTNFSDASMSTDGKVGFRGSFKQPVAPKKSQGIFVFE
ncbi:MAG: hypothetical protein A3G41_07095 [Elusimicrobia bacterium RIFCSPLOWO2_12_FULL_59_9]|nr:MAG: hypothetical protein A3G41_07095 [Elusimicrobia bacterium RIFCSPLOWO2_12_FULL_59_9]